jgi:hypothetical protein
MIIDREERAHLEEQLHRQLTSQFLATLKLAVRLYGDSGDSVATRDFAHWCYSEAGQDASCLDALEYPVDD